MNTKLNLTLIVVTVLLVAAACSPAAHSSTSSSPISDIAQPLASDKKVALVAVTGENASVTVQDNQAYPSQQLHHDCVSKDNQRQDGCVEKQPSQSTNALIFAGNRNADTSTYPSQQLHSGCGSEDSQRQDNCIP